jgi:hypothetical protein
VRRIALAALLSCFLFPTLALAGSGEPRVHLVAADQRVARVGLVRLADLNPDYVVDRTHMANVFIPRCPGSYAPDRSDLTVTGTARSSFRNASSWIASNAAVYRTDGEAAAWWDRVVGPALATCSGRMLVRYPPKGMRGRLLSVRALRVHGLDVADRSAGYRIAMRFTNARGSMLMYRDLIFTMKSRAISSVGVASLVHPCGCGMGLAQTVVVRLIHARY